MAWWRKILQSKAFTKYLLVTNAVTATFLDGLADYAEQKVEKVRPHDWGRTARMAAMGFILGPTEHYWYKFLDRRLPQRDTRTVIKKVLLEMTTIGPLEIVVFYVGMCWMERRTWPYTVNELKEKFMVTYKLEWVFWPVVQLVNFYYVPPVLRVIYANVANFVWSMILSYLKHHNLMKNSNSSTKDLNNYTSTGTRNRG